MLIKSPGFKLARGENALRPGHFRTAGAEQHHGDRLAAAADDFAQHFGDQLVFANAELGVCDQHFVGMADDLGGFFDKRDFFGAFHRANFLHDIGGVFEFHLGSAVRIFSKVPQGTTPSGRAHETR